MKDLVAWLNSARKYADGVEVYKKLGKDAELLRYFTSAHTTMSQDKLFQTLRQLYYALKKAANEKSIRQSIKPSETSSNDKENTQKSNDSNSRISRPLVLQTVATQNEMLRGDSSLKEACKNEADKIYKEMMNVRALLFAQCHIEPVPGENSSAAVAIRKEMALRVVNMQPAMNEAYKKLHYVEEHGKLPDADDQEDELPTNPIELERMRSNLLKNISRHKRNPDQSAERIALIKKHELTLKRVYDVIDKL